MERQVAIGTSREGIRDGAPRRISAARGDPEGNYRRLELIQVLLENYFHVRGQRFQGAKKSLRWLEQFDPLAFRTFCMALQPNASHQAIASLVHLMVGEADA